MSTQGIAERKVLTVADLLVINVENGRGEELRQHLLSHNIDSVVSPAVGTPFERLEIHGDEDPVILQAIVDKWEQ